MSPYANTARKLWVSYKEEWAALERAPKLVAPHGAWLERSLPSNVVSEKIPERGRVVSLII